MGIDVFIDTLRFIMDSIRAYWRKYSRYEDVDNIIPYLWIGSERHNSHKWNEVDTRCIKEGGMPTKKQIKKLLKQADIVNHPGHTLVFCRMGRSRSAMIVILYLVSIGWKLEDAIELVKSERKFIHFNKKQRRFLNDYTQTKRKHV